MFATRRDLDRALKRHLMHRRTDLCLAEIGRIIEELPLVSEELFQPIGLFQTQAAYRQMQDSVRGACGTGERTFLKEEFRSVQDFLRRYDPPNQYLVLDRYLRVTDWEQIKKITAQPRPRKAYAATMTSLRALVQANCTDFVFNELLVHVCTDETLLDVISRPPDPIRPSKRRHPADDPHSIDAASDGGRKRLQAYISEVSYDLIQDFAAQHSVSVSSLVEALAFELAIGTRTSRERFDTRLRTAVDRAKRTDVRRNRNPGT